MARAVGTKARGPTLELDLRLIPCSSVSHTARYDCTQLWSLPALNTSRYVAFIFFFFVCLPLSLFFF
jgi:hypothetical protein